MCESSAAAAAEALLSAAPPGAPARLVLDLSYPSAEAAAVARDLATGVLGRIETLLAGPATDLPAQLRAAVAALADAPAEQAAGQAPSRSWTRRWRGPGATPRATVRAAVARWSKSWGTGMEWVMTQPAKSSGIAWANA